MLLGFAMLYLVASLGIGVVAATWLLFGLCFTKKLYRMNLATIGDFYRERNACCGHAGRFPWTQVFT